MSSLNMLRSLCCCGTQWGAGILVTLMSSCMSVGTRDTLHYWENVGSQLNDVLSRKQYWKGNFRGGGKKTEISSLNVKHIHMIWTVQWLNCSIKCKIYLIHTNVTRQLLKWFWQFNIELSFNVSTTDQISRSGHTDLCAHKHLSKK